MIEPYGSVSTPGGASGGTSIGASTLHAKGMPTLRFSYILIDIMGRAQDVLIEMTKQQRHLSCTYISGSDELLLRIFSLSVPSLMAAITAP